MAAVVDGLVVLLIFGAPTVALFRASWRRLRRKNGRISPTWVVMLFASEAIGVEVLAAFVNQLLDMR